MPYSNTVKLHFETILVKKEAKITDIVPQIEQVQITKAYEDQNYIGFEGVSLSEKGVCQHCGMVLTKVKDRRFSYTSLGLFNSRVVVLKLKKKLYYCPLCCRSTAERLLHIEGQEQRTKPFIDSMIASLKETVSYSTVARTHKISVSNLIRHFDKAVLAENKVNVEDVRNLSIDEVGIMKNKGCGNYQCIFKDADRNMVVGILKTRQKVAVKEYMDSTFKNLSTVSQDLWNPYRQVVYELFPDCKVIADQFHVVRQFMWAFSRTRIAIAKKQNHSTNKNWKLLTKRCKKLDERGRFKLDRILKEDAELKIAHQAKEMALELFESKDKFEYIERLAVFKEFIEEHNLIEFKKAYRCIQNWEKEVLNMIESSYSNGSMERTNRLIKQSKNIAFGFKNLERTTKLIQYRANSLEEQFPLN